jgi:hypothetical protein
MAAVLPRVIIGAVAYVTFLISAQIPFGFRGDYQRMDLIKSLPIRPLAVAVGQLAVVVAMLTLLQWLILAAGAIALPASAAELLLAGLFAFPFTWIVFGMEDLLFLLFPSPMVTTGSEGFLKMGRVMLFMLAKFLALGACAVLAAVPAGIVYVISKSTPAAALVAWCALLIPGIAILAVIAWAFQRYDVGAEGSE